LAAWKAAAQYLRDHGRDQIIQDIEWWCGLLALGVPRKTFKTLKSRSFSEATTVAKKFACDLNDFALLAPARA
jgi:hypothetical protein